MRWLQSADAPDTGSASLDLLLPFLNLGIVIVLLMFLVAGKFIVPRWTYDKALTDAQEAADDAASQLAREVADRDAGHAREMELLKTHLEQMKTDNLELRHTNSQLTQVAQEQFLPALIEANRLTAQYIETINRRPQP